MDKIVSIKPFERVKTAVVTSMRVTVMRIELFNCATLHVSLLDENEHCVESKVVEIDGYDYKQWGGDDTFVYDFVARKLGFSMPVEESVVSEVPAVTE